MRYGLVLFLIQAVLALCPLYIAQAALMFPGLARPQLGEQPDNPADSTKKPVPRSLQEENPNPERGPPSGNLKPYLQFKERNDHQFEIIESDPRLGEEFKPGTISPSPPNPPAPN
jgi:hypothetical protein